ncbi:uncharacterized protein LOC124088885 [Marmota monax]|uniref:uncharacterized protein LOC124088885 n=1 Tax=Marmota monax TaxID=9995 RepID=UPI001EB05563|nr:uncharacterized protein LOC124088885 [Marmota monax]
MGISAFRRLVGNSLLRLEHRMPCLVSSCQNRFIKMSLILPQISYKALFCLTCLQIFPNKERSYKHGNHHPQKWQTAVVHGQSLAEPLGKKPWTVAVPPVHLELTRRTPSRNVGVFTGMLSRAGLNLPELASEKQPAQEAVLGRTLGFGEGGISTTISCVPWASPLAPAASNAAGKGEGLFHPALSFCGPGNPLGELVVSPGP